MIGDPPSLAAFFEIWRKNPGDFLQDEGDFGVRRFSYSKIAGFAQGFAQRLRRNGIGKGDRILIWGENRSEWIVALWGAILEGVVAVPVDYRSSEALAVKIAEIVQARAILIGDSVPQEARFPVPVWFLSEMESGSAEPIRAAPPDDLAEVLFTSGATGDPKGVTITHRNILANLKPIDHGISKYRKYMGPFSPIRFLNLLPLSHMFGQSMAAFIPAMIAGTVIFMPGFSPQGAARIVRRRRISVMVCVPQMLDLLRDYVLQSIPEAAEAPRSKKWYWAWWQYRRVHKLLGMKFWAFVVGAAPLESELEAFWRKLGFVVIQGYGLTETAPVATLNHPFETRQGSVGKPIAGVKVRIADDGEILLRGENITPGYYGEIASSNLDEEGWFHTGDIGQQDADGSLSILGRKKEMIVSADGLNVYPQDVERALQSQLGVREAAVVGAHQIGARQDGREQVHAVLVLDSGADPETIIREANRQLETHQRVRGFSLWPNPALPRTAGTSKLKRSEVASWLAGKPLSEDPVGAFPKGSSVEEVLGKYAGGRQLTPNTALDELGLSSLDRIQLMMDLETRTGASISEESFGQARTVGDLTSPRPISQEPSTGTFEFPEWNRSAPARWLRRVALPVVILPLARAFAWIKVEGLENLTAEAGPVIFASNHQSHFDLPSILWALPARWRYRLSTAMSKEFFDAHFHRARHSIGERFRSSLMYYLSCLLLNTFPLPQREAGARSSLRYAGELISDKWSILIFPEGVRTNAGEVYPFQPGVGMLASRLRVPVIPVKLVGLHRILHKDAKFASPGKAWVKFGPSLYFEGEDYASIARQIAEAVQNL